MYCTEPCLSRGGGYILYRAFSGGGGVYIVHSLVWGEEGGYIVQSLVWGEEGVGALYPANTSRVRTLCLIAAFQIILEFVEFSIRVRTARQLVLWDARITSLC